MIDIVSAVILFVVAIFFHELGHYAVFRVWGIKPNIKFTSYSIEVSHPLGWEFTPRQQLVVLIAGVLAGIPFVYHNFYLISLYVILSTSDIINIYALWGHKHKNVSLLEINKQMYEQAESELAEYKHKAGLL